MFVLRKKDSSSSYVQRYVPLPQVRKNVLRIGSYCTQGENKYESDVEFLMFVALLQVDVGKTSCTDYLHWTIAKAKAILLEKVFIRM